MRVFTQPRPRAINLNFALVLGMSHISTLSGLNLVIVSLICSLIYNQPHFKRDVFHSFGVDTSCVTE